MAPDDELMLLGTIGFAVKCEPPGNICGVFLLGTQVYLGCLGHIGDMNDGPKHDELELAVRNSQENYFSFISASPRAKARPASFILWSEFQFLVHPLRWSFFGVLTFSGNFQSECPPC